MFDDQAPLGAHITGFRVCQSGLSEFANLAAGFDLYFSDGTTISVLGCYDRIDPYEQVMLDTSQRFTQVTLDRFFTGISY